MFDIPCVNGVDKVEETIENGGIKPQEEEEICVNYNMELMEKVLPSISAVLWII